MLDDTNPINEYIWRLTYKNMFKNFFINMLVLRFCGKYYLVNQMIQQGLEPTEENYSELNYNHGLVEKDFYYILDDENSKCNKIKNKIVLFCYQDVFGKEFVSRYSKDLFWSVIYLSLIFGDYDKYGIDFKDVLLKIKKRGLIDNEFIFYCSLERGKHESTAARYNSNNGLYLNYKKKLYKTLFWLLKFKK